MHLVRVLLFTAIGALAIGNIGTNQYNSKSTSYNLAAKKTGYVEKSRSLGGVIYVTETRYLAVTHVVTVIEAAKSSDKENLPSYSFVESDGKTEWLGEKTPPASRSYDVVTSYITVQPSVGTVTITRPRSAPSIKAFVGAAHTGVGKEGWNHTSFATFKPASTQLISTTASTFASSERATFSGTAYPEKYQTARARRVLYPRALGDVVVATIDGVEVSWTNDFDGLTARTVATVDQQPSSTVLETPATSSTSVSLAAPVTSSQLVPPIYPWDLDIPMDSNGGSSSLISLTSSAILFPLSTSTSTSTSSTLSPSVTLAVYPWDLAFQPIASSTSTTIATEALGPKSVSSLTTASTEITTSSSPSPSITLAVYPWDLAFQSIPATSTTLATQVSSTKVVSSSSAIGTGIAVPNSCSSASPSFTVTFDDLPRFDISLDPENTDIPPIPSPYRKLYWQNHFGYVPPPSDPFPPKSPPQLAVYRAGNTFDEGGSPTNGAQQPGEIGAGPRSSDSAYWVDAHSVWFGCADGGPDPCEVTVNGYREGVTGVSVTQNFSVPPCPGLKGCALHLVQFVTGMTGLSGLQILASVKGTPLDYYIDNLVLSWSNNSCAAQQERASSE